MWQIIHDTWSTWGLEVQIDIFIGSLFFNFTHGLLIQQVSVRYDAFFHYYNFNGQQCNITKVLYFTSYVTAVNANTLFFVCFVFFTGGMMWDVFARNEFESKYVDLYAECNL